MPRRYSWAAHSCLPEILGQITACATLLWSSAGFFRMTRWLLFSSALLLPFMEQGEHSGQGQGTSVTDKERRVPVVRLYLLTLALAPSFFQRLTTHSLWTFYWSSSLPHHQSNVSLGCDQVSILTRATGMDSLELTCLRMSWPQMVRSQCSCHSWDA